VVPANIGLPGTTGSVKVEFGVRNNGDSRQRWITVYVAGFSDAWHAQGSITDSYLTGQLVQANDHMEAFINGGEGNPTVLNHNTILTFKASTGEAGSADVALYNDFGGIGRVEVTNNLLAGGGVSDVRRREERDRQRHRADHGPRQPHQPGDLAERQP
jgi:hypothetical protein